MSPHQLANKRFLLLATDIETGLNESARPRAQLHKLKIVRFPTPLATLEKAEFLEFQINQALMRYCERMTKDPAQKSNP